MTTWVTGDCNHPPQLYNNTMGLLLSLPLAGGLGTVATSCLAGLAFCFTSTAGQSQTVLIVKLAHERPQLPCFLSHVTAIPPLQLVLDLLYGISCGTFNLKLNAFQIIFSLNSILAWVMKTDAAIKLIQKWSFDYIKMECSGEKCYGVLAVCIVFMILLDCWN